MKFSFSVSSEPNGSFRTAALQGLYDLTDKNYSQSFTGELPIESFDWNIGLIVGSSGSGKSSISRACFGEFDNYSWSAKSLIDDFPKELDSNAIFETLSSVGFASPPYWLKPYSVLSNGEKMRCDLARAIVSDKSPIVFDEFTSVVDRHIAQIGSLAVARCIRRAKKKFIAVSCHRDIIEWLEPDWVYDTDEKRFFFTRKSVKDPQSPLRSVGASAGFGPSLASITI